MNKSIALMLSLISTHCFAVNPMCYEDPATNALTCVDMDVMTIKGDVRSAILATGGPKGLALTNKTLEVNCASKFAKLRDKQGVVFASGNFYQTSLLKAIAPVMCNTSPKSKKPR